MLVKELINELIKYPRDMEVITIDGEYGLPLTINNIEISKRRTNEYIKDYVILR